MDGVISHIDLCLLKCVALLIVLLLFVVNEFIIYGVESRRGFLKMIIVDVLHVSDL